MKTLKILLIVLVVYVGVVVAFESLLGYLQPAGAGTMVVTTTDAGGTSYDRVVARLDSEGQLYPDSVHGFFNDATPERYNQVTAEEAWTRDRVVQPIHTGGGLNPVGPDKRPYPIPHQCRLN